jgi:hypothetical protein
VYFLQEQAMLTKLILAQLHSEDSSSSSSVASWQAAALQLPLLQQVVFSTNRKTKAWAAAGMTQLQQMNQKCSSSSSSSSSMSVLTQQGPLATLAAVEQLMDTWWSSNSSSSSSNVMPVLRWLSCLSDSLQQIKHGSSSGSSAAAAAGGKRSSVSALTVPLPSASVVRDLEDSSAGDTAGVLLSVGGLAWFSSHGLNPAVQLLLAALLQHPDADVAVAAADVLQQLVLLLPQLAPNFLPLVLQQMRAAYTAAAAAAGGGGTSSSRIAAALLQLLPAMCYDSSTAALVWRMLQPLMAATKPDQALHIKQQQYNIGLYSSTTGLTRSLAVQVAVAAWKLTGQGWTRAEAAVNGCIKPSEVLGAGYGAQGLGLGPGREPLELRLLRATAMR